MSATGWQESVLRGIGASSTALAELYPRLYLVLATLFALAGYACLLLFPGLAVAGLAGVYRTLGASPGIAWLALPVWLAAAVAGGFVSYGLFRLRPALPGGFELRRGQAPALFNFVADSAAHFDGPTVERIVVTGDYRLELVATPRRALLPGTVHTLLIGLPLLQCLSTTRFDCLLARRLGQFSRRANPLLNRLFALRAVWSAYQVPAAAADPACRPLHWLFTRYAPLYDAFSTPAARLDELQADSYAMELFSDEEVLDAITADCVIRVFLRERYWPAIRKLGARVAADITKSHVGMVAVLRAGVQADNIDHWIETAMSMEQDWDDTWPLLARRLDNIGHAQACMEPGLGESAAAAYLAVSKTEIESGLEDPPVPVMPRPQPLLQRLAGLQRRAERFLRGLMAHGKLPPRAQDQADGLRH